MRAACAAAFLAEADSTREMSMGFAFGRGGRTGRLETFERPGIRWTAPLVAGRLFLRSLPALLGVAPRRSGSIA